MANYYCLSGTTCELVQSITHRLGAVGAVRTDFFVGLMGGVAHRRLSVTTGGGTLLYTGRSGDVSILNLIKSDESSTPPFGVSRRNRGTVRDRANEGEGSGEDTW